MRQRTVIVIGGGLAGPLVALFLARRGYAVDLFESRGDPRRETTAAGRSINLTLAERGLAALRELGLEREVVDNLCIRLRGRAVHQRSGETDFIPYGREEHEVLYAVSRAGLTRFLLDACADRPGIRLHFHQQCVELNADAAAVTVADRRTGARQQHRADFVVGADGVHSEVRRQLLHGRFLDFAQYYVPWRYKELTVAAGSGFDPNALHVWPRGDRMMFAIPNPDGSFNGVCVLPADGAESFATLRTEAEVRAFLARDFADALPHLPALAREFVGRREAAFATVKTSAWRYRDKVVLIGDACHGVIPFYGQGMNAAFEDCRLLDRHLADYPDRSVSFAEYERSRRPDTTALAELCERNFTELRDTVQRPTVAARKRIGLLLNRVLGDRALPLYTMISHTSIPYAECVRRARRADRVARLLGIDLAVGVLAVAIALDRRARWGAARVAAAARRTRGAVAAIWAGLVGLGHAQGAATQIPAEPAPTAEPVAELATARRPSRPGAAIAAGTAAGVRVASGNPPGARAGSAKTTGGEGDADGYRAAA
jgi:kynurenine 3-monooxygenase